MPHEVEIVEVGPRDGLQNERVILTTEQKVQMINLLVEAGLRRIEVASFVNPRLVPQMADAEALIDSLDRARGVTYVGLVLNKKGARRALSTQVDQLGVGVVASDTFGIRNQGQTVRQSIDEAKAIVRLAHNEGRSVQVSIAVAFECPFEGRINPAAVLDIASELAESGLAEIGIADTIGVAVPAQVTELVSLLRESITGLPIRAHFHDTKRTGLANAWAAVLAGVKTLDASLGGLGGCPFAPNASGNIATEDLVDLLERSNVRTAIELPKVIEAGHWIRGVVRKTSSADTNRLSTWQRFPAAKDNVAPGESSHGPLSDVRVIELGALIAGPFCGQLLGDFGAEVIKIEPPGVGDAIRSWGKKIDGEGLWWSVIGRNKKSVTLDLRRPEGQSLVARLISTADVLIENFRPGTMEKWGLGYDVLSKDHERLIMARMSGFGQSGPYRDRAGFGSIGEAMGGIRYVTGKPDAPPVRCGVSIGDSLTALFATLGITTALHALEVTGRGQVIDAAIYESVLALMENVVVEYDQLGHIRGRTGSILPGIAPSNVYPCQDADVLIGANGDGVFRRLAEAMDKASLAEPGAFKTHNERAARQAELDSIISVWTSSQSSEDVLNLMHKHGVPAGPIYRAPEMISDPQFLERASIIGVEHPTLGVIKMQNVFPRLSETPGAIRWPGPALGKHNEEILGGLLGLSTQELADLRDRGTV